MSILSSEEIELLHRWAFVTLLLRSTDHLRSIYTDIDKPTKKQLRRISKVLVKAADSAMDISLDASTQLNSELDALSKVPPLLAAMFRDAILLATVYENRQGIATEFRELLVKIHEIIEESKEKSKSATKSVAELEDEYAQNNFGGSQLRQFGTAMNRASYEAMKYNRQAEDYERVLKSIRSDYEFLVSMSREEGWTNRTPVSPKIFWQWPLLFLQRLFSR